MTSLDFRELDLDAPSCAPLLSAVETRFGSAIGHAARFMERLFLLRSGWAPGLCFVGGLANPIAADPRYSDFPRFSIAGASDQFESAFAACIGEGVERLAQLERPGDVHSTSPLSEVRDRLLPGLTTLLSEAHAEIGLDEHATCDWVEGRNLANDLPVLLPADWCLRRARGESKLLPRSALSTGAAAGPTLEAATERALLELVERDAAGLWWRGGRRGRPLPLELSAIQGGSELVQALRGENAERASWLLDLTTDIAIPVIAALSFDTSGRGFTCGFAARLTFEEAARAAIIEMMQMELGLQLARGKQASMGESALSEVDRMHLKRATAIDSNTCDLVHPDGAPTARSDAPRGSAIDVLRAAFARSEIDVAILDLTRSQFGIPVVFALAPALQPMPSLTTTPRLRWLLSSAAFDASKLPGVALF